MIPHSTSAGVAQLTGIENTASSLKHRLTPAYVRFEGNLVKVPFKLAVKERSTKQSISETFNIH